MDYEKHYTKLIEKAKGRTKIDDEYYENHHIIPRCLGGSDDCDNIVALTAKEHFIAHALLYKIYRTSSLAHAWFSMTISSGNQKRYTSKLFEAAKKAHIRHLRESNSGDGNPYFGKKHTPEIRKKISNSVKAHFDKNGLTKKQVEAQEKFREHVKKPKSVEHKRKIGRKGLIMIYNSDQSVYNRISKDELDIYLKSGWEVIDHRQKKYTCKKCGKTTTSTNIKRWHNENCSQLGSYEDKSKKRKTDRKNICVKIDGKEFKSIRQASIELQISKYQVRKLNEN